MTIYQIQCLLAYLGYNPGPIDGVNGVQTRAAVKEFQTNSDLVADGDAGVLTQEALLEAANSGSFCPKNESAASEITSSGGNFWDSIQYFTRNEFRCQCNGKYCNGFPAEPAETLVRVADRVRSHFGASVTVSSGVRCSAHNAEVGGVSNSRHLTGHAMDYCVRGHTAAEVLTYVQHQPEIKYAYAINSNYIHMDIGA